MLHLSSAIFRDGARHLEALESDILILRSCIYIFLTSLDFTWLYFPELDVALSYLFKISVLRGFALTSPLYVSIHLLQVIGVLYSIHVFFLIYLLICKNIASILCLICTGTGVARHLSVRLENYFRLKDYWRSLDLL